MSLKDAIAGLAEASGTSAYTIAKHLAEAKPSDSSRPDSYGSTVRRVLNNPDKASWENLKLVLEALGVDAEAALAIAISAATKAKA
ncbi:hypothetical protein VB780_05275 [Leptolyngbya sp. CCNP1308]|uniref:hypothetical protein n=1 Tax=Leptolyngbya sp. CCNP1308 TaxID=3110255 RepID=UPI002B220AAD|nr:hypothetical protein [Leptolyngbya sp. CCNP1308]MEA5447970.1 hypothetical protein [Leptolyngbya sp. CCNP1308]